MTYSLIKLETVIVHISIKVQEPLRKIIENNYHLTREYDGRKPNYWEIQLDYFSTIMMRFVLMECSFSLPNAHFTEPYIKIEIVHDDTKFYIYISENNTKIYINCLIVS